MCRNRERTPPKQILTIAKRIIIIKPIAPIKTVMDEENIAANLELVLVESPEDAQNVEFQGSPKSKVIGVISFSSLP